VVQSLGLLYQVVNVSHGTARTCCYHLEQHQFMLSGIYPEEVLCILSFKYLIHLMDTSEGAIPFDWTNIV
jgi:hypothetical protein